MPAKNKKTKQKTITEKTRNAKSRQTRVATLEYNLPVSVPPKRKGPAAPVHPVDTSTEQWQDIKVSCITLDYSTTVTLIS